MHEATKAHLLSLPTAHFPYYTTEFDSPPSTPKSFDGLVQQREDFKRFLRVMVVSCKIACSLHGTFQTR